MKQSLIEMSEIFGGVVCNVHWRNGLWREQKKVKIRKKED